MKKRESSSEVEPLSANQEVPSSNLGSRSLIDFEEALATIETMAERLAAAAQVFRDARLILGGTPSLRPNYSIASLRNSPPPVPAEPYPCLACGRGGPEKPGELAGDAECLTCGNHMPLAAGQPGTVKTNKGVMLLDPARRAQLMQQPAFDEEGNPA